MNQNISSDEIEEKVAEKEEIIQHLTRELVDVKNFTESIIQSIGSGIIITEMNDTITYINKAGERILGYTIEELMGRPFSIFSLKEKERAAPSFLNNPDDLDTRKEGWMRRKDHSEFPVGFTINSHLSIRGERIGKIVVFRDLTSIYKIQEEILRMDRLISLGKLASGIAHELRNPLAGIKTTAQALGEEMSGDDSRREYLHRITKEIDRLNDLLKTFFSFAKPQNLTLVRCHIKDIINEIIPFLIKEIADKGIRFVEAYHPELPRIKVDKTQMHQVFLNLFLNAIQAMPTGGELKIEASPMISNSLKGVNQNFIKVVISDTGRGIPTHIVHKIFDPFFTTKPKGIGLGLSITYQIIKKHGGTIKVESQWEKGTSFIINLPETLEN
ncbi:MAG TPA: ATP-binding protein [Thermodesulfobacteriota bacterium]|nr:ATP-binding protein [Thermodesulfobacteriota bacterium]